MRVLKKLKEDRLLFFDIETASVVPKLKLDTPLFDSWAYKVNKGGEMSNDEIIESYSIKSGLYPEFAKVISIVVGKIVKGEIRLITLDHDSEKELLHSFNDILERNLKCNLVGFVNHSFDTPFIYKRMVINKITPHDKVDSSGLKPWDIVDTDLALEWKGNSFERASLLNVATAFGLPSPKDDVAGADVGRVYWAQGRKGLARISEYCRKDVITTINVFKCMRIEEPLEVADDADKEEVVEDSLFKNLLNGGKYGAAEKKELKARLDAMDKDERDKAMVVLTAMTSTAKNKKTKITKAHLKALI